MITEKTLLQDYYSRRAGGYEEIYHRTDPVRQKEFVEIANDMKKILVNRNVLEVACGTGFWTAIAAQVADSILATDISEEMLAVAKTKALPAGRVQFRICDAYKLDSIASRFNAGLANFWLSHVHKSRLNEFLLQFHKKLGLGASVFMADNVYVPRLGGELITKPGCEDTFKLRELADGSKHEVLKNYYDAGQLREILGPVASELKIRIGDCFWWVSYFVH